MLAGQSLGLPFPGTIVITSAALLAAQGQPIRARVAATAALGTAIGHSAGYRSDAGAASRYWNA